MFFWWLFLNPLFFVAGCALVLRNAMVVVGFYFVIAVVDDNADGLVFATDIAYRKSRTVVVTVS